MSEAMKHKLHIALGEGIEDMVMNQDWENIERIEVTSFNSAMERVAFIRGMTFRYRNSGNKPWDHAFVTEKEYEAWKAR